VGNSSGGFEGNAQSFRIVTKLAFKSTKHSGLDLTAGTLAAILKYPWLKGTNPKKKKKWGAYSCERRDFEFARKICNSGKLNPSPEAALMDWADDVTYCVHDVEDFFRAGKIPVHLLARANENAERKRFFDDVYRRRAKEKDFPVRAVLEEAFENTLGMYWRIFEPYSGTQDHRSRLRFFTSQLIHRYVNAVTIDTKTRTIKIDDEYMKEVKILKELTWTYVIESPSLALQRQGQREVITRLFEVYADAAESEAERSVFPPYYREEIEKTNSSAKRRRLVCDLIAGMTEPEAIEQHRQTMSGGPPLSLQEIVR
jgi:dGTPase